MKGTPLMEELGTDPGELYKKLMRYQQCIKKGENKTSAVMKSFNFRPQDIKTITEKEILFFLIMGMSSVATAVDYLAPGKPS